MRRTLQRLFAALVLLLGVVFLLTRFAEMQAVAQTIRRGDWRFIALAILIVGVWFVNVAAVYRAIYRALGMEERIEALLLLSAASDFANVVAPTVGMSGMAVFIGAARKRGYSSARVTVAGVLFLLVDYTAFLIVLALGLAVLLRRGNLNSPELIASGFLFCTAAGVATLLYLGMRSAHALGSALAWLARLVNRLVWPFMRRAYLSEERAFSFAQEAADGLHTLKQGGETLLLPVALALSSKALLITVLFLMFMAFKTPFSVGTLVAGFSIGYLFMIVSPTPAGIGIVEGALALGLNSLNVPLGAATVIALAYRGVVFWLPLLARMAAFRYVSDREQL